MIHFGPGQNIIDLSGVLTFQGARSTGAAAAVMYVYDSFTIANGSDLVGHVPDISSNGAAWEDGSLAAGAQVYGGKVASLDFTPIGQLITTEVSDCSIYATFVLPSDSGANVYLYFRKTDANNYWRFEWAASGNGVRIRERTSSTNYIRASTTQTFTAGETHILKVTLSGDSISTYIDDVLKLAYSSSVRNTVKTHGFLITQPNLDGSMDDFTITAPSGGGTPSTAGYAMGVLGLTYSS